MGDNSIFLSPILFILYNPFDFGYMLLGFSTSEKKVLGDRIPFSTNSHFSCRQKLGTAIKESLVAAK
ncbi:hypothetical protein [uncultured Granulicatella sp.]|uniref:hypothetical protein n=1 Tax=uncultured Granulicatella sp. TaxID=316089 RepID=UPI0028D5A949|nr:hypothetical protein [uncultured Granulicatella sp.]